MKRIWYSFVLAGIFLVNRSDCFNEKFSSIVNDVEFVRRVSRCTEAASRALFNPLNDISIVVSNCSSRLSDLAREIITTTFANRSVEILTDFSIVPTVPSIVPQRKSSVLVIERTSNLRKLMGESSAKNRAEYIIIVIKVTNKWLTKFTDFLSRLQFVNVAFVRVTARGRSVLVHPLENPLSADLPPILKNFDVCNPALMLNSTFFKSHQKSSTVQPFSRWVRNSAKRTLSFARIVEGTEGPDHYYHSENGKPTSFGVDVLRLFADWKNIELERHEWPNQSTSTWTDAMIRCLAGEFDFFYAVLPPSMSDITDDIEAVYWYKYEVLTFVDTPKKPLPLLTAILIPYRGTVWLCTLGIFGAFALFAYAIDNLWRRGLIRERITILSVWSIFVDQSLPSLPVKFGLRVIIGMWILHNLMRNSGYTAVFSSSLTATDGSHLLKSFQDIFDSGRPICGSSKAKLLLNDSSDSVISEIYKRFEAVSPVTIFDAVFNGNYIGTRHLTFVERHNMINRANEALRLYTLSEATIINYPSFYFSKRGNPYNKEFKLIVSRSHEAGLIKWIEQKYLVLLDKTSNEMPISSSSHYLRLTDLLFLFKLLCVGHIMSLLVFIIEIFIHARSAKKLAKRKS